MPTLTEPAVQSTVSGDAVVALQEKLRLESQLKNGAGWFFWIAGLSMINTIIVLTGSTWHFIFGLGLTEIVDSIAMHMAAMGQLAAIVVNTFIAGVLVLFGVFGRKSCKWSFVVGIGVYALDGLLLLMFRDFLGSAFHGLALYSMYRGMAAIGPLNAIRDAESALKPPEAVQSAAAGL